MFSRGTLSESQELALLTKLSAGLSRGRYLVMWSRIVFFCLGSITIRMMPGIPDLVLMIRTS